MKESNLSLLEGAEWFRRLVLKQLAPLCCRSGSNPMRGNCQLLTEGRGLRGRVVKASRLETIRPSPLGFESHER